MRGALRIDGVSNVDVTAGKREFCVTYDPETVSPDTLVAAIEKAGEEVELRD